jgi:hypothetical protein
VSFLHQFADVPPGVSPFGLKFREERWHSRLDVDFALLENLLFVYHVGRFVFFRSVDQRLKDAN